MRGLTTNLLLLAVVIGLLLLALYEPGIEAPAEPEKLLSLSAAEVQEITIHNGEQLPIHLRRLSATAWRMVEPLQVSANRYKVETLLDIMKQEPINRFTVEREKLEGYGLYKPQVELIFDGPKGEQRLLFGSQTPLNGYRYLQLGDETVTCRDAHMPQAQGCVRVATIKDSGFYPVASLYTNFIASRLLPEGVQIASIRLPDYQIKFAEGGWKVEPMREGVARVEVEEIGGDRLAQWIDGWRYASSVDIESISKRHETEDLQEVVITLESGDEIRWSVLNQQDGVALGRRDLGIEYHLSGSQREALLSLPPKEQAAPQVPQKGHI